LVEVRKIRYSGSSQILELQVGSWLVSPFDSLTGLTIVQITASVEKNNSLFFKVYPNLVTGGIGCFWSKQNVQQVLACE
jgi:hypothetical protein